MKNNEQLGIVLLGLGPGDPSLLTLQAWEWLHSISQVYVRTRQHPTLVGLPTNVEILTFDHLYEQAATFEEVYEKIITSVIELGKLTEGVTYAVPGHPFVAEATCPEIAMRAKAAGIPVKVIEGLSFLEPACTALGIDPLPHLVLVDALDLAALHTPSFSPAQPALVAQIYSREIASDVKLTLNAVYPDTHPVRLVHAAGTQHQVVEDLKLYEIDRSEHIGLMSTLYLPPLAEGASIEEFQEVVAHLRAPDGCPWDREQTQQSMGAYLLEESYEAVSALEEGDIEGYCEELGDLLMVILMAAQIASEDGDFSFAQVVQGINRKIIRRHPHVFGQVQVADTSGVLRNWEKIKEDERNEKGKENGKKPKGILESVPKALPSLMQAQEYQARAARVGFDWPEIQGVIAKIEEEWQEVSQAVSSKDREQELGDLLFAIVNLVRWYQADAETVLRKANQRFLQRFSHIEQSAREQGRKLSDLSLEEMEQLWQEAKRR